MTRLYLYSTTHLAHTSLPSMTFAISIRKILSASCSRIGDNDACLPNVKDHRNLQRFPKYVVNATEPAHAKAGVDFARERNVRLIVKGTRHDYLGR